MKFSAGMTASYPKLTAWITKNASTLPTKAAVWSAFKTYAELTDAEARSAAVTIGTEPTVDFKVMPGANGMFSGGTDANRVYLAKSICDRFEGSAAEQANAKMHKLVESTVLHEMVHWGDHRDGVDQSGEEGKAFETAAYGADVDRYW